MMKTNVVEINGMVEKLSKVEERPVFIGNEGSIFRAPQVKAIWNSKMDCLAKILSSGYVPVQHQQAFAPIIEGLRMAGHDNVFARLYETRSKAVMEIAVPQATITPKDGNEIFIGFRVVNSFDGTTAVRLDGFGMRQCCQNQMILKNLLGSTRIKHFGNAAKIHGQVQSLLFGLAEKLPALTEKIDLAIEQSLDTQTARAVLEKLKVPKKPLERILTNFELEEGSVWRLFNAMTSYATHSTKSFQSYERYSQKAEKMLLNRRST